MDKVILAQCLLLTLLLIPPLSVNASPSWLSGFSYRVPITITNIRNTTIHDYQIPVVLDTSSLIKQGKLKPDLSDIRFTDSDGVTLIPYWIEGGPNTSATRIWVKVPLISAFAKIYLYYGNPSADPQSNGSAVFDFFDDFNTLDTGRWRPYTKDAQILVHDGLLDMSSGTAKKRSALGSLISPSPVGSYVLHARVMGHFKIHPNLSEQVGTLTILVGFSGDSDAFPEDVFEAYTFHRVTLKQPQKKSPNATIEASGTYCVYDSRAKKSVCRPGALLDVWHSVDVFPNGTVCFHRDDGFSLELSLGTVPSRPYIFLGMKATASGAHAYFDYVFLRKYVYPEPSVSLGSEEEYRQPESETPSNTSSGTPVSQPSPSQSQPSSGGNPPASVSLPSGRQSEVVTSPSPEGPYILVVPSSPPVFALFGIPIPSLGVSPAVLLLLISFTFLLLVLHRKRRKAPWLK